MISSSITDPFYSQISVTYSGTVQLEETLHFLDLAYPDWKTHGELGSFAAEFVLWVLDHTSESFKKDPFRNYLKFLYAEIADEYSNYKNSQADFFEIDCVTLFEEQIIFSSDDIDDLSEFQFQKFKASKREENAFDFLF